MSISKHILKRRNCNYSTTLVDAENISILGAGEEERIFTVCLDPIYSINPQNRLITRSKWINEVSRPLLLKPGNQIKIIDRKKNASGDAEILSAGEREFSLFLLSYLDLNPGDELEVEAPQREDALYIIRATVLEDAKLGTYNLKQLGEEQRWQRRKSERIPVNYRAEYIPLFEKSCIDSFQEGRILNISRGGVLLVVNTPLQLMSELQLFFEIPLNRENEVSTGMKGKVVREHLPAAGGAWQYGYGVEFEEPFTALSV